MRPLTQSRAADRKAQRRNLAGAAEHAPRVSVIVPVRNDPRRLQRCMASIRASRYPADRMEIVVADNGSTDATPQVARTSGADVLLCPDMSIAKLRNLAARAARGDILVFVDADHEIGRDWVRLAVESLRWPGAGAVGAPYCPPADATWVQQLYDAFRVRTPGVHPVDWLATGSLAIWRHVFNDLGGFDTTLETCEDVEFCQRLRREGYALLSDSRLRSVHHGDPSTLRALFFGELWRGRDNLRVSLRDPLTLRALPSVVIPIASLCLIVLAFGGVLTLPYGGLPLVLGAGIGLLLLAAVRVVRMLGRINAVGVRTIARAFAVALVYEIARALALVVRVPHRMRRRGSRALAHARKGHRR